MANDTSPKGQRQVILKRLMYAAFGVLICVVLWQQRRTFGDSIDQLVDVNPIWVVVGFSALMLSVLASAAVYKSLSPKKLDYQRTVIVQTAGLGLNRLLPAGSGALGVSYLYLRSNNLSKSLSAAVAAGNNIIGFIGHAILLLVAVILWPEVFQDFSGLKASNFWWFIIGALSLVLFIIIVGLVSRRGKLLKNLRPLFKEPHRIIIAIFWSLIITLCYALAVILSANALGYDLSIPAALIILSFGVLAASVIPVPGGVGAAEAGLYFGLHSYGISEIDALAIAILYRVMTFWLPLIVGGLAFIFVTKNNYLTQKA